MATLAEQRWRRLALCLAALWFGSLSAIGFLAVPLLFAHAPSPAQAGRLAARLFTGQWWLTLGCALPLLGIFAKNRLGAGVEWSRNALFLIVIGVWLAALVELLVAPRIVARDNLALWHTVGSVGYALQWLCAATLVWRWPTADATPRQVNRPDAS